MSFAVTPQPNELARRTLTPGAFVLLLLAQACGSEPAITSDVDEQDAPILDSGETNDTDFDLGNEPADTGRPDTDSGDGDDSGDDDATDTDRSADVQTDASDGLPDGELCEDDDECESGQCVTIGGGSGGSVSVCADTCASSDDCPEGSECVLVVNSGADAERVCVPTDFCFDPDNDGFGIGDGCRGPDCEPGESSVNSAADELCNGVDDDCDGRVDDATVETGTSCDTSFAGQCAAGRFACVDGALECQQSNALVDESCDGLDNDCDGEVDEGNPPNAPLWYLDSDSDGFGEAATAIRACTAPSGHVDQAGDCNDANTAVNPDAIEVCDGVDNNCDGLNDDASAADAATWFADTDRDTYGNAAASRVSCSAPSGFVADASDCNDASTVSFPGATEICDGLDNNCDTVVDEGSPANATTWYADVDEDGFGDPDVSQQLCVAPDGYVRNDDDCNDGVLEISPDGVELCDDVDNDCDGFVDEDEALDRLTWYADTDRDGYGNPAATREACEVPVGFVADSTDCNDASTISYPLAAEICDGLDNDCDGDIDEDGATGERTFYRDQDADTFGDAAVTILACRAPEGYVVNAQDCNDASDAISPDGVETCDGVDNNCNRVVDEDAAVDAPTWYADTDDDTFGNPRATRRACASPEGYVADNTDCNDSSAISFPGATEICDSIDNNCNGFADEAGADGEIEFWRDADSDTFGDPADSILRCTRPSGYVLNSRDCNDATAAVSPNATEVCDGIDNDCDTRTDEPDATDARIWFADTDNDLFGNPGASLRACNAPAGYVADNTDCNDSSLVSNPSAPEICDTLDNDCDGSADEAGANGERLFYRDNDNDLYGNPTISAQACTAPSGFVTNNTDCNDSTNAANPGILNETCDNLDNNCNGTIDESLVRTCTTACGSGSETCGAGTWAGCTAPPVLPETCDRVDNNCNGAIDDGISCTVAVHRRRVVTGSAPPVPPRGLCPAGSLRTQARYLYTTDITEGNPSWTTETANDFYVYSAPAPGLAPLYRCYENVSDRFFWTLDPNCELWARPAQGILGYIATGPSADTVPLYRSVSGYVPQHFYTDDAAEAQLYNQCREYEIEGIAGYVWQR
jgi:hypothetical protein